MLRTMINHIFPAPSAHAHCDGPCGVYDPASARIAAEAVLSMSQKIVAMDCPDPSNKAAYIEYHNKFNRYVAIKDEQAHLAKEELLVLWTDYFKPKHLAEYPNLHTTFWNAAKLCSACKVEVSVTHAKELMDAIKEIHDIFWATKGRDVAWYVAKP